MLQSPIFHVNGEDPEAVTQIVRMALDFRQEFQRDVVIDMYCYRKRGHNEADEPSFTQPLLYQTIEKHKSSREAYLEHLLKLGGLTREEADKIETQRRENLEKELSVAHSEKFVPRTDVFPNGWTNYVGGRESGVEEVDTGVSRDRLAELLERQTRLPADFHPSSEDRNARLKTGPKWPVANAPRLGFGRIAGLGEPVGRRFPRSTRGQDSGRGTFSQRHAVLHDYQGRPQVRPLAAPGAEAIAGRNLQ